jgi:predicted AAA+ superfamily ATPase
MAQSNIERVGKALELMNRGLQPFVERELKAVHGHRWMDVAQEGLREAKVGGGAGGALRWDSQAILAVMVNQWNVVFKNTLGQAERSLVGELREVRNRWAHQNPFSTDDAYRALDSIHRLLVAVSAEEAAEVERQKQELLRVRFEEQARREARKGAVAAIEGQPAGGLKPWREVVTPHPDVASGRYQQAEFAADLGQVHRGDATAADEYKNPTEFFRRTFLTDGLRHLLTGALQRLASKGGDPVVELQTNFGGGKTHSMLALYHLFSGTSASELPGIEPVLQASGVSLPPKVRRAVLVGTAISPGQVHRKDDGTVVRTLWGELAWQLLKKDGYALVAEADERGVNPGDGLRLLFQKAAPCLMLIDEWVAYVRQVYGTGGLPAGSFDANLTFAQALTESARAVPGTLVVASLPASDIEIGGEGGREALARLKNTFGRMESVWRPASTEEGFEIVRRRLFQPMTDPRLFAARDAVVRAFSELYRNQAQEFPSDCREADYERRLTAAYPIHPELFDRLYNDWSSLDKFQRTRGVLRLMAAVIHALWERHDVSLMILPASVPVDEPPVQFELTRYMEDPWVPVIEKDVDGPNSLPLRLDRENPNLGRYSACRRVARTLYLGSAPTLYTAQRGLEDRSIKLGCVQPGESVATFGDALRRLTDGATHLYVDGKRYWLSTQPTVTRLAQDRATQQDAEVVAEEIRQRLRKEANTRGDFDRVHACPTTSADIPDAREARLVILGPESVHIAKDKADAARKKAEEILAWRGSNPRLYRNTLVFLAPDRNRLAELEQAVRQYLAWKSIEDEKEELNLDAFQANQAKTRREGADETIRQRIPETYQWLLVPGQPDPKADVEWEEIRLQGPDALAVRASKRLRSDMLLIPLFAGTLLRRELDRIPLWRGDHVSLKQLAEDFAQYLYLPRLKTIDVLLGAARDGVGLLTWREETFAYAEGWDADRGRYQGLRTQEQVSLSADGTALLVNPEAAARQLDATRTEDDRERKGGKETDIRVGGGGGTGGGGTGTVARPQPKRFHGSVNLDVLRTGRDAGQVAQEVIQHLSGLVGARVEITLEIHAEISDGVPDHVVRTVAENCRTLRFKSHGFEED